MFKLEAVGNMVIQLLAPHKPQVRLTFLAICRLSQDYGMKNGRKANPAVCSSSRERLALEVEGSRKATKKLDRPLSTLKELGLIKPLVDKPGFGKRQEYRIMLADMLANNPLMVEALKERWAAATQNIEYLEEVVARGREGKGA